MSAFIGNIVSNMTSMIHSVDSQYLLLVPTIYMMEEKYLLAKELRISSYVLINPCIHGVCENKTETPCMDKARAYTFKNYRCECFTGY